MTAYIYKEWVFGDFMCHFENLIIFVCSYFLIRKYLIILNYSILQKQGVSSSGLFNSYSNDN